MRRLFLALLLAMAAPAAAQHAQHADHAQETDEAAVMATVDRLFGALASKDRAALLGAVVAEGRATSAGVGAQGRPEIHSTDWTTFADRLTRSTEQYRERLVDPHVHVEGDIAMIWSRYEFERDGAFSHCGIDHFDLVRIDGRWRVLNLTWTRQMTGCPGR